MHISDLKTCTWTYFGHFWNRSMYIYDDSRVIWVLLRKKTLSENQNALKKALQTIECESITFWAHLWRIKGYQSLTYWIKNQPIGAPFGVWINHHFGICWAIKYQFYRSNLFNEDLFWIVSHKLPQRCKDIFSQDVYFCFWKFWLLFELWSIEILWAWWIKCPFMAWMVNDSDLVSIGDLQRTQ